LDNAEPPIRAATLAKRFAKEAAKMRLLERVRKFLKKRYVLSITSVKRTEIEAVTLSMRMRELT
jgi:hypothetical protein